MKKLYILVKIGRENAENEGREKEKRPEQSKLVYGHGD